MAPQELQASSNNNQVMPDLSSENQRVDEAQAQQISEAVQQEFEHLPRQNHQPNTEREWPAVGIELLDEDIYLDAADRQRVNNVRSRHQSVDR